MRRLQGASPREFAVARNVDTPRRHGPIDRGRIVMLVALLAAWIVGVSVAVPATAGEAEDQYAVAAGHYAQRDWRLAVKEFEVLLEKHPTHASVEASTFFLGEALLQIERYSAAATRFAEYLRRAPKGPYAKTAQFRLAEAAYLAGLGNQAERDLEQFLQKYPGDPLGAFALPYLGETRLSLDKPAQAEKAFREALDRFPEGRMQDDCRLGLAKAAKAQGRNEEARRMLSVLMVKQNGPLAEEARFRLGILQCQDGDHNEALTTLAPFETSPSLSKSPWRGRAALGRAAALKRLERFDEAKAILVRLTGDRQLGVEAQYWIGLIELDRRQWKAAAETMRKLARENPRHKLAPAFHFYAGDALMRADRPEEASKEFDAALTGPGKDEDNPWRDDALRGKIQLAVKAKEGTTVDRLATDFLRKHAESPLANDVRRLSARSMLERHQYGQAARLLEPLCAGDARDAQSLEDRYLLALAYEGCHRPKDALAMLRPVVESAQGQLQAQASLAEASLLASTDQFGEAKTRLEQYLATKPEGPEAVKAQARLAVGLAQHGQMEHAKKLYTTLLAHRATDPLLLPATEQLAEAAYDAGDYAWAAELYGWLIEQNHGSKNASLVRALSGLAWSQLKTGQPVKAEATFERLLRSEPDPKLAAEAAWARGRLLEQLNRPDGALAMYDQILQRHTKSAQHPKALLAAARLRDRLQRDDEAAKLYRQFATDYPKNDRLDAVLYEWSWVLEETGKTDESATLRERLVREFPESRFTADAAYRLAQRAAETKDFEAAEKWLDRVLASRPGDELTQHALCLQWQIAGARKQWEIVRRAAGQLVRDYPESPLRLAAEFWVAESDYRIDQLESAGQRFDDLDKRRQGHKDAWLAIVPLRRAQILARKKQWKDALALVRAIPKEYPQFEQQHEVDYLLGRCLASQADFEAAREAYRRVIRSETGAKTETAAMAQWMIGETYFHQKDYETAVREYLRVEMLYAFPRWQAGALLQAGKCYERLGQWDAAAQLYARVINSYPTTAFAEEAAARLRDVTPKTRIHQARQPKQAEDAIR
ncbi:MAG: tetratricopeptide repeat protein [Pirellulales bacterium]|nr:tetratricopeptide repeat protein [Pirellulales bacterium]